MTTSIGNYVAEERRVARLGESWTTDQVIVSWLQVKQDTNNWKDGHNAVLHEFAHRQGYFILKSCLSVSNPKEHKR
nr:zinc-dependent peptidase [Nostoc sp. KVJ3]